MPLVTDVHKQIERPIADAAEPSCAAIDEDAAPAAADSLPRSSITPPGRSRRKPMPPRPSDTPRRMNRVIC